MPRIASGPSLVVLKTSFCGSATSAAAEVATCDLINELSHSYHLVIIMDMMIEFTMNILSFNPEFLTLSSSCNSWEAVATAAMFGS